MAEVIVMMMRRVLGLSWFSYTRSESLLGSALLLVAGDETP
jgi:hypothetical protein